MKSLRAVAALRLPPPGLGRGRRRPRAAAPRPPTRIERADIAAPPTGEDRGIAVTNYLLAKHMRNGAAPETYDTTCITLRAPRRRPRRAPGAAADADRERRRLRDVLGRPVAPVRLDAAHRLGAVHAGVPAVQARARDGRRDVGPARARARPAGAAGARTYRRAWNVRGLAADRARLAVRQRPGAAVHAARAAGHPAGGAWASRRAWRRTSPPTPPRRPPRRARDRGCTGASRSRWSCWRCCAWSTAAATGKWLQVVAPLAIAGVALTARCSPCRRLLQWITALTFLAMLTTAQRVRAAHRRRPLSAGARGRAAGCGPLSALLMLGSAVHETQVLAAPAWRDVWVHAALFTTETVLLVIKWWWIVGGPAAGGVVRRRPVARRESGYASRASIGTGRLGITVSIGMFLAVTMTIWALVNNVLDASVEGAGYRPCIFAMQPAAAAPRRPRRPPAPTRACGPARTPRRPPPRSRMPSAQRGAGRPLRQEHQRVLAARHAAADAGGLPAGDVHAQRARRAEADRRVAARRAPAGAGQAQRQRATAPPPLRQRTQHARALGRWLTFGYRWLDLVVARRQRRSAWR